VSVMWRPANPENGGPKPPLPEPCQREIERAGGSTAMTTAFWWLGSTEPSYSSAPSGGTKEGDRAAAIGPETLKPELALLPNLRVR